MIKATGKTKGAILGKLYRLKLSKSKPPTTKPMKVKPKCDKIVVTPKDGYKLEDLKPNQCRYPKGDKNFTFCGKEIHKGSYCEEHYIRCHISKGEYRERDVPINRQW